MKKILLSAALLFATTASASATEVFTNPAAFDGLSAAPSAATALVDDCLSPDSSSRAIRACTKVMRASAPNKDIRARLLTQRAVHQMALGRFDAAAKDFTRAGELSGDAGLESMGHGFVAMLDEDLSSARANFEDCTRTASVAPLAEYGLGLTHQMAGETQAAADAYDRALALRPQWSAVTEQIETLPTR